MAIKMIMTTPSQLPLKIHTLGGTLAKQTRQAMVRTARFGQTAVVRTAAKTTPKPEATQTYRNSWSTSKTRTGAIMGNSSLASYFVEVGRRPGKMPPFTSQEEGILPWVRAKRFRFDPKGNVIRKRSRKDKKKEKKTTPAEKERNKEKSQAAEGAKPAAKRKVKTPKVSVGKQQLRFAYLVARKIAKKGTPGRFVLLRTMPTISKRAKTELKKATKITTGLSG